MIAQHDEVMKNQVQCNECLGLVIQLKKDTTTKRNEIDRKEEVLVDTQKKFRKYRDSTKAVIRDLEIRLGIPPTPSKTGSPY